MLPCSELGVADVITIIINFNSRPPLMLPTNELLYNLCHIKCKSKSMKSKQLKIAVCCMLLHNRTRACLCSCNLMLLYNHLLYNHLQSW